MDTQKISIESIPIACNLPEMALINRKQTTIASIFSQVEKQVELSDGYEYWFSADFPLQTLFDFIQVERQCCGFFTFELVVNPHATALRLRGSREIKQFIEHNLGSIQA